MWAAAYDKAVNKANAEIAKQMAMETNSEFKGNAKQNDKKDKPSMKSAKSKVWKAGMPCRAIYLGDGVEYEAVISVILEEGECVVRFLGYNNSEIVPIASLKESRGDEVRRCQIELAKGDKFDDGFENLSHEDISFEANKKGKSSMKSAKSKVWKVGMPCRAVYFGDGVEYEAVIRAILEDGECVVRFFGYNNFEIVLIASLKESRGDEVRCCQIELAKEQDKFDDGFESLSNEDISFEASAASIQQKGQKSKNKSRKANFPDFPKMPNIPGMPDLFRLNSAFNGPAMPDFRLPDPEEALSSMLINWYMSGYYTGLYQGLKRGKENRRR